MTKDFDFPPAFCNLGARVLFLQPGDELTRILNQEKSVVVVGGGLAGLACAYELG
ncbi:hypothetical protein [Scytonema sp. PRP1]|uniref:hypothetical protein n=1 Tax=Scytonema sp. PRP1 TaxID=3120513 RepID=UPI002FD1A232